MPRGLRPRRIRQPLLQMLTPCAGQSIRLPGTATFCNLDRRHHPSSHQLLQSGIDLPEAFAPKMGNTALDSFVHVVAGHRLDAQHTQDSPCGLVQPHFLTIYLEDILSSKKCSPLSVRSFARIGCKSKILRVIYCASRVAQCSSSLDSRLFFKKSVDKGLGEELHEIVHLLADAHVAYGKI